jgi:histidine ammonia-lyase
VETELNSQSDNPLVSLGDQAMVHNSNFHPIVLALAFDGLRGRSPTSASSASAA